MSKSMYCNNCGEKGHAFKSCSEPVLSCGLMLLRGIQEPLVLPVEPSTISVLMVRRKDSMSYMEFIRGKYDPTNIEYLKTQISNMTISEQKLIKLIKWTLSDKAQALATDINYASLPVELRKKVLAQVAKVKTN